MTGVMRALRLDAWTLKPYVRSYGLIVIAICLVGLAMRNPYQLTWPFGFFAMIFAMAVFQLQERFQLNVLYAQVPVSRRSLVLARYLGVVIMLVAAPIVGCVLGWIYATIAGIADFNAGTALVVGLLVSCVAAVVIACQTPLFFALPYAKARMWTIVPVVVMAAVMGFMMAKVGMGDDGGLSRGPAFSFNWLFFGVLAVSVIALVVSVAFSLRLYARRDL